MGEIAAAHQLVARVARRCPARRSAAPSSTAARASSSRGRAVLEHRHRLLEEPDPARSRRPRRRARRGRGRAPRGRPTGARDSRCSAATASARALVARRCVRERRPRARTAAQDDELRAGPPRPEQRARRSARSAPAHGRSAGRRRWAGASVQLDQLASARSAASCSAPIGLHQDERREDVCADPAAERGGGERLEQAERLARGAGGVGELAARETRVAPAAPRSTPRNRALADACGTGRASERLDEVARVGQHALPGRRGSRHRDDAPRPSPAPAEGATAELGDACRPWRRVRVICDAQAASIARSATVSPGRRSRCGRRSGHARPRRPAASRRSRAGGARGRDDPAAARGPRVSSSSTADCQPGSPAMACAQTRLAAARCAGVGGERERLRGGGDGRRKIVRKQRELGEPDEDLRARRGASSISPSARSIEVAGRRRSAPSPAARCAAPQSTSAEARLSGRLAAEEVRGRAAGVGRVQPGARIAQQPGGLPMPLGALERRQRVVHGSLQDGLGVGHRRVVPEHARAHEERRSPAHAPSRSRPASAAACADGCLAEHRHRACEALDGLGVAAEARCDVAAHRFGRERLDRRAAPGLSGHVRAGADRPPARRRGTAVHRSARGRRRRPHRWARTSSSRRRTARTPSLPSGAGVRKNVSGIAGQRLQPPGLHPRLAAAPRRDDGHRQLPGSVTEEAEEVERGPIAPLQIVDRDEQRRLASRGGRSAGTRLRSDRSPRPTRAAPTARCRARTRPPARRGRAATAAPRRSSAAIRASSNCLHDAEAVAALQLAPAGIEHDGAARLGIGHRGAQQARAADPALAVEQHEPSVPRPRAGERGVDHLALCVSLHEHGPAAVWDGCRDTGAARCLEADIQAEPPPPSVRKWLAGDEPK